MPERRFGLFPLVLHFSRGSHEFVGTSPANAPSPLAAGYFFWGNRSRSAADGEFRVDSIPSDLTSTKNSIKKLPPASSPSIHPTRSAGKMTEDHWKPAEKPLLPSSDKVKLQLFPVNEDILKLLQEGGHNPYLELTLNQRKKISSVLSHLITKWAISRTAHELVLFPYEDKKVDLLGQKMWTLNDKETSAADVYFAVGQPQIFRLKYGLRHDLEKNKRTESNRCRTVAEGQLKGLAGGNETDLLHVQGRPVGTTEKGVNSLLSWMDCVTSVSVGQLLAETSKVNQSGQLVNTDSFDVAILGLMAQNHDSSYSTLSSIWEAEETRHAFPSTKTAFSKDQILPASNQIVVQDHNQKESSVESKPDSQTEEIQIPHPGLLNFGWDSLGSFGFGLAKPITGAEGSSLSSLDPFQTCSLFAVESTPSS